jgi:hypothetical protein
MSSESYLARSEIEFLPEVDGDELETAETNISRLYEGLHSFPGSQYFDEIMHEKSKPKKLAKPMRS